MRFVAGLALLVVFATTACGARAPQQPRTTVQAAIVAPPEPKRATADDCEATSECAAVGTTLALAGDNAGAAIALGKACSGAERSIDACALLAGVLRVSGAEPERVVVAAREGCTAYGVDDLKRPTRAAACELLGEALRDGVGAGVDLPRAIRAFESGCLLGDDRSCDASRELHAKAVEAENAHQAADGVADANIAVDAVASGILGVANVSCRADDGIGALAEAGALASPFVQRKRKLDNCSYGNPHEARVRWTAVGGRIAEAHVISAADPSNRCIERTLLGARVPVAGTCAATVVVGTAVVAKRK